MSQIRIRNFGPIQSGYEENGGFIDIKQVTVFIGNQGTGKSTVTKLISTLTWLEKALIRGDLKEKDLVQYNRFKNKYAAYQNISNYFQSNTEIEYKGKAYCINYSQGNLNVIKNTDNGYLVPKIMYVPAERNFISAVDKPNTLKKLPNTLYTFLDEFENAKRELKDTLLLPINNVRFEYQKLNNISWVVGENYKIRLSEASSGFQSLIPLFLVTRYLALSINKQRDPSKKELSIEEEKRIKQEIGKILSNKNLSEEIKQAALEILSDTFKNSCFINIVEEPEQNLYPSSQKEMLYKLIEFANLTEGNKLIVTTHSPYIINYLTLAIKGKTLLEKINHSLNPEAFLVEFERIVPKKSVVAAEDVAIYELTETGIINKLPTYDGLPSDDNFLNEMLAEGNALFDNLLEIEEKL